MRPHLSLKNYCYCLIMELDSVAMYVTIFVNIKKVNPIKLNQVFISGYPGLIVQADIHSFLGVHLKSLFHLLNKFTR